jgi:hypothetical protein
MKHGQTFAECRSQQKAFFASVISCAKSLDTSAFKQKAEQNSPDPAISWDLSYMYQNNSYQLFSQQI